MDMRERAVKNSKIVVLGFSYKENVGDPRESPVEVFVEELKKRGARICIVDPYIEDGYLNGFGEVERDVYVALRDADALVLTTAHRELKELNLLKAKERMRTPIMIDGRRMFEKEEAKEIGFTYRGVGTGIKLNVMKHNMKSANNLKGYY